MESRRRFTRDFKVGVLRELDGGKSAAEVCREYEIHPSLLSKWQRLYLENPKEAFAGHGNTYRLEAKLAERDRLIGQLYAENELLKKAIANKTQYLAEQRRLRRAGGSI
jgi:transposase